MYTTERNIQIVISLLKAHGIKYVVASPGSMNATFVTSIQDDKDFILYSCVDERSAAYMACGIAAEKGEPIVLSCTGATASRNYMPGLTEAYYRKLPILAITSLSSRQYVGQLIGQQIDRTSQPKDVVVDSVYLPLIKDARDENVCEREANKAILSLWKNGGGPVHIDLGSCISTDGVDVLPEARAIKRYTHLDSLPPMPQGRIGIMLGVHEKMDDELMSFIDNFCSTYDAIVYCVNPKSYTGKYAANVSLLFSQKNYIGALNKPKLCIHIGEVNTDAVGFNLMPQEVWRVNVDGEVKDHYGCLTNIFQMTEKEFFYYYATTKGEKISQLLEWMKEDEYIRNLIPDIPFSNGWIAQQLAQKLPKGVELYLGILNSVRAWDYANPPRELCTHANVGGFGIDGCVSSMVGASIVSPDKQFYGVFGDLAFFYDMNILGNKHIGKNIHILLVNNDGGQQFRNSDHPISKLGWDVVNPNVAAAGHYGCKSQVLVKHFSEDLGFSYISASNKEEFIDVLPIFLRENHPVVFEVFTKAEEEETTFAILRGLLGVPDGSKSKSIKKTIKSIIGSEKAHALKTLLGI